MLKYGKQALQTSWAHFNSKIEDNMADSNA